MRTSKRSLAAPGLLAWLFVATSSVNGLAVPRNASLFGPQCRYLPGDAQWPSTSDWNTLNTTVGGRLSANVPMGSVCHGDSYNETACTQMQQGWSHPITYEPYPGSLMNPWWQNGSCDPFHSKESTCSLGNYPKFYIEPESADDVAAGVNFAREKNVRLVVHNTGHDFMGRSGGHGALSLAMHKLKTINIVSNYTSTYYSGPAGKFGAGLRAYEIYSAVHNAGYQAMGGDCPTVGLVGGYTQGGGHGALSSLYGMGADQVLEWEAITTDGKHVVATPDNEHKDLYWALSGGGGGNFAVVLSMTVRVFPSSGPVAGAKLAIHDSPSKVPDGAFWDAVSAYHAALPALFAAGGSDEHTIMANRSFGIARITAPGWNETQLRGWLAPLTETLDAHNSSYTLNVTVSPDYYSHYVLFQGPLPAGRYGAGILAHTRLVPGSVVGSKPLNAGLTAALRDLTSRPDTDGFSFAFISQDTSAKALKPVADNAVLPQWRDASMSCIIAAPYDFAADRAAHDTQLDHLMKVLAPRFVLATPGGASYPNEANWDLDTWQRDFYGLTWPRLSAIKRAVDPEGVLWGIRNVGSQEWSLADDGRLCKVL